MKMRHLPWIGALGLMLSLLSLLSSCGGGGGAATDAGSGAGSGGEVSVPPPAPPDPPVSPAPPPPPSAATLTAPVGFADGLSGSLSLAATVADASTVANVEFQVDGVQVASDTSAPYGATVDTTQYTAGQHVVRARSRDSAGNGSAWSSAIVRIGGSRTQPAGFTRNESWLAGLTGATAFAQAPDGRLFVAEQGGTLRIVKNGALLATPFITLSVDANGERGLIGVALHPDFATNRWVYVHYTSPENGSHGRISRYTANPSTPDIVSVGSEVRIADLPALSSATNHNGGALHFGSDGKLYVGVGDNANGANAQNLASPLGKLLRFNDDGTIPGDNPFFGTQTGLARAIWAYGLRNPFTFAVQPGTGRLHINDVGEGTWEEIDLGAAGANYGWPATEGPTTATGVTAPLSAYKHSAAAPPGSGPGGFFTGFSIAGGAFYPAGGSFPAVYGGRYFFADFVSKFIGVVDLANGTDTYSFASLTNNPVDLTVGLDGSLYALTRNSIVRISAP